MKKTLKSIGSAIGSVIGTVFGLLLLCVLCVCYLFFRPFDLIRYHKMPYYRDTKRKYAFAITSSQCVRLYNAMVKNNLPMQYAQNGETEYFIKDGEILFCDYYDRMEQIDGQWYFLEEDETTETGYAPSRSVKEELSELKDGVKEEHKMLPARLLLCYEDCDEFMSETLLEEAKLCSYFYCIEGIETLVSALQKSNEKAV